MKVLIYLIFSISFLTLCTSCEGFKVLSVHNSSKSDIRIKIKPGLGDFNAPKVNQIRNYLASYSDSSFVVLKPDSSLTILSIFTGMMFNVKIKERELRTDFLQIETSSGTTIADSREKIIDLIYGKLKANIKGEGRNIATISIE